MRLRKKNYYLISFLFLLFIFNKISCFVRDFVESVNVIRISSQRQKIVNFNKVILEGEVEVLVDNKIHLWADQIEIDKEKQTLVAQKKECGSVVIENKDFLILADKFFLNLDDKTGYADNIRIHVAEGYIRAGKAEKLSENNWQMEDMLYTPCDAPTPHWSITARKAKLYSSYFVRVTGVLFKAGSIPFFAIPTMVFPIQNRSKSGFLMPKFSYDDDLGFGIREEFYWSIFPRCDSTIGVDWKDQRGIAFLDEFRWARSPESFTIINSHYGLEKNAFVKKNDRILKETEKRYWIEGKDFQTIKSEYLGRDFNSLFRIDFGTDKRIGYYFFDNVLGVGDTFYNSWILRTRDKNNLISFMFDGSKTSRSQFVPFTESEYKQILKILPLELSSSDQRGLFSRKKEIEDAVETYKIPHLELNTIYKNFKNLVGYRHDIFLDQVISRKRKTERYYVESRVVKEQDIFSLSKPDTLRFFYNANLQACLMLKDQILRFYVDPVVQLASHLKNRRIKAKENVLEGKLFSKGAYRIFTPLGAEWNFPEALLEDDEQNLYFFQPTIKWDFLPKFKQDHWYHSDRWDRFYPKNQIAFELRNNWYLQNVQLDLNLSQAFDFYNSSDVFSLQRCPEQKHLAPFKVEFGLDCDMLNLEINQEYNLKDFRLLQSEIRCDFSLNKFKLCVGTLYQDPKLQNQRELYSDIPHFLLCNISVPILKHATIFYDGQFYSKKDSKLFPFEGLKPLYHGIRLEYEGHCWGISLGFEEKLYKQYGNWKSDRAFTLFVRLESLGSFARKFKKPDISNKNF